MKKGGMYSITYQKSGKTILATFLEAGNGVYYFKDTHGSFELVTQKRVKRGEITITAVED